MATALSERISHAFGKASAALGDTITLEGGQPVPCTVAEFEISSERETGRNVGTTSAIITIRGNTPPEPGTALELSHGGRTYDLFVATDREARITGGGALVEFTASSDV